MPPRLSIQFITIIILGGLASLLGSVLGACFLIVLPELLAGLDVWQALVYGLIMVVGQSSPPVPRPALDDRGRRQ